VEAEATELAALARGFFDAHAHKTLATLRRDGSPRVSGTEVDFAEGELWLGSMWRSLKAPVAASLVRIAMAGGLPYMHRPPLLLDPFCGAGTILAEAGLMGLEVIGGDLHSGAVRAAHENLRDIGASDRVRRWDARRLPLGDDSVDRVVTNIPWGRQVAVDSGLEHLYRESFSEMLHVFAPGGRIVVLTGTPELLAPFRSRLVGRRQISLSGQRPHILVFGP